MITISLEGIDELKARFNLIRERVKEPQSAMETIAAIGWKDVMNHFRDEEGPEGRWPSLAKSTISTRRGGSSSKMLQDTGRLRLSHRYRTFSREAHVYTTVGYAGIHNNDGPRTKIPQRKFLWLSESAKTLINKTLLRWIAEGRLTLGPVN